MSEPEEQENDVSDDEDSQNARARKRIPAWARKEAVIEALHRQATERLNPDTIFFECNTCDLKEIFKNHPREKSE